METSKRRSYTSEQREVVLADVRAIGVMAAAKKHDVPQSCVSRWASVAGVKRAASMAADVAAPPRAGSPPSSSLPAKADDGGHAGTSPPAAAPTPRTSRSRVAKVYSPSQKAVVLEDAAKDGVTAAAKKHGISRFSIYDWQRRLKKAAAGEGPSPASGPAPKDIEQQRDAEILEEWKTHPGLGPSQIVNQLRRKGVKVSVHTARRVMEDAGYRPPKVVRQKHDRRFEAVRPNHLWHLDFVQRFIGRVSTLRHPLVSLATHRAAPAGRRTC